MQDVTSSTAVQCWPLPPCGGERRCGGVQGGDAAAEALSQLQEAPAGQMEFCWNIKVMPPLLLLCYEPHTVGRTCEDDCSGSWTTRSRRHLQS